MLNFTHTLVVHNVHFLRRGFLEFLASTARIRNTKKKKKEKEEERDGREREREEEETSQHPPFLFSFEEKRGKRERERWEDRRQEAEGKKHSCALLPRGVSDTSRAPVVSYSRPGIEQVSRRRRKPRMAGRKSGGGKDVGGEK